LQTQALLAHWKPGHIHADARDPLLTAALPVAVGIDDAVAAMALLEPFGLEDLAADAVADFLALIPQYGVSWTLQCLQGWEATRGPQASRYVPERAWHWVVNTLPSLVRHTADSNSAEAIDLIRPVIDTYWVALNQDLARIRDTAGQASSIGEQQKLAPAMLVLLDAAHALHGADREQAMMATLQSGAYRLPFLLGILHAASEAPAWRRLSPLRTWCTDLLTRLLDTPTRAPGDWSISAPGDFPEAAAPIFREFLRSSQQQSLTWPLAKAGRDSIQAWIRHHGLPIRCSVLKTGSPHKLVLEKTRNLFVQATRERQAMVQELAWLRSHAD